jgi:hypothetical protein
VVFRSIGMPYFSRILSLMPKLYAWLADLSVIKVGYFLSLIYQKKFRHKNLELLIKDRIFLYSRSLTGERIFQLLCQRPEFRPAAC